MPPKRGKKRQTDSGAATNHEHTNGTSPLLAPDRSSWPGWVEMESEPAFFNVMLKEIGVRGVRVQEVYSLDDEMLAVLPQPVHALIFLFRYRETDHEEPSQNECPQHVWFANQTPDFACATFALLNIVNNIPDLELGGELRKFKIFTRDMDPLSRGDAIDDFNFVKRIHNSFAYENDLFQVDIHLREKAAKAKKKQALAKARATREAKKAAALVVYPPSRDIPESINSHRQSPIMSKPSASTADTVSSPSRDPVKHSASNQPVKLTQAKANASRVASAGESGTSDDEYHGGRALSHMADEHKLRRSGRARKPSSAAVPELAADTANEDGFHFVAYMPIRGHVWKLDGLDKLPRDLGCYDECANGWMDIARPVLTDRMAQYEGAEIEFNLMAVVHDPLLKDRSAYIENLATNLQYEARLDDIYDEWRSIDNADNINDSSKYQGVSVGLGIEEAELRAYNISAEMKEMIAKEENLPKLLQSRTCLLKQQVGLRAAVRDAIEATKADEENARHRRHGYGSLVRSWLGALADEGALLALLGE